MLKEREKGRRAEAGRACALGSSDFVPGSEMTMHLALARLLSAVIMPESQATPSRCFPNVTALWPGDAVVADAQI